MAQNARCLHAVRTENHVGEGPDYPLPPRANQASGSDPSPQARPAQAPSAGCRLPGPPSFSKGAAQVQIGQSDQRFKIVSQSSPTELGLSMGSFW
jgi:hypothetical protein